jgi:hypothetical protein
MPKETLRIRASRLLFLNLKPRRALYKVVMLLLICNQDLILPHKQDVHSHAKKKKKVMRLPLILAEHTKGITRKKR